MSTQFFSEYAYNWVRTVIDCVPLAIFGWTTKLADKQGIIRANKPHTPCCAVACINCIYGWGLCSCLVPFARVCVAFRFAAESKSTF